MSKATLDAIDGKILQYLVRNARMPFLEIARECGIFQGAAIHQAHPKFGPIWGNPGPSRPIADLKMLGFDVCAFSESAICVQDPTVYDADDGELKEIPEIVAEPSLYHRKFSTFW